METGLLMADLWQWYAKDTLPVFESDGTACLASYFVFKKSVHVGIYVKGEDYGISHTCYPYTPILIRLPPKLQPYPISRADIVELRNCFAVES